MQGTERWDGGAAFEQLRSFQEISVQEATQRRHYGEGVAESSGGANHFRDKLRHSRIRGEIQR